MSGPGRFITYDQLAELVSSEHNKGFTAGHDLGVSVGRLQLHDEVAKLNAENERLAEDVLRAARTIWAEIAAERRAAHEKHGDRSMESFTPWDRERLAILMEEVGEVARVLNDAEQAYNPDFTALRRELVQVAAMAGAWAESCRDVVENNGAPF